MKAIFSKSGGCISIWWYLEKALGNESIPCPTIASTNWFTRGNEKLSFGQTPFKFVYSTHTLNFLHFLGTNTSLANQLGYSISLIKSASSRLLIFICMTFYQFEWKYRTFYRIRHAIRITFTLCEATIGSIPSIFECFHANTFLFILNTCLKQFHSSLVNKILTYAICS